MIYKKLLIPLDGSRISESVLPYARAFAKALHIPAEFLEVIGPEVMRLPAETSARQIRDIEAEIRKTSLAYLTGIAGMFFDGVTARFSVETGNPAEVIVNRAAADSGTLITMASHGHSGFQRWLLGSVAHKVASIATNPLLIVRAAEAMKRNREAELKSILVPLDGSEIAELALPHAAELARELVIELVVIRVCDLSPYLRYPQDVKITIAGELKSEAERYLEEKIRQLEAQGLEELSYLVLEGNPAFEIIDLAQRKSESMVVMCTHGKTGMKRWLLGSVTEQVISHASGPALIVHAC